MKVIETRLTWLLFQILIDPLREGENKNSFLYLRVDSALRRRSGSSKPACRDDKSRSILLLHVGSSTGRRHDRVRRRGRISGASYWSNNAAARLMKSSVTGRCEHGGGRDSRPGAESGAGLWLLHIPLVPRLPAWAGLGNCPVSCGDRFQRESSSQWAQISSGTNTTISRSTRTGEVRAAIARRDTGGSESAG